MDSNLSSTSFEADSELTTDHRVDVTRSAKRKASEQVVDKSKAYSDCAYGITKRKRFSRYRVPKICTIPGVLGTLRWRELCNSSSKSLKIQQARSQFKNYRLTEKIDVHDTAGIDVKLCLLWKRSKVVEIATAHEFVFGLTQIGICSAFTLRPYSKICFLNIESDEVIRSLVYNKSNDSIITVSVYSADNYSSLKCRSTPINNIRCRRPTAGFSILDSESLRWPGFVEFDDVNKKVLTFSAETNAYKVWDLVTYNFLYSISYNDIREVKISPGIILVIHNRGLCGSLMPLKILNIETGAVLQSYKHKLDKGAKIDLIEQFNENLLVKQENRDLQIVDIYTGDIKEITSTKFLTPTAFIFLYEIQLLLTFRDRLITVWSFQGELVTEFEDHKMWHAECNTNNIYITTTQDLIISYCQNPEQGTQEGLDEATMDGIGTINISDIFSGKCLAKISSSNEAISPSLREDIFTCLRSTNAIYYCEDSGDVIAGSNNGNIYIWSR